jgi:hypothetical protein
MPLRNTLTSLRGGAVRGASAFHLKQLETERDPLA